MRICKILSLIGVLLITINVSAEVDYGTFEVPHGVKAATEEILNERCPGLFYHKYVSKMPPVEVRELTIEKIEQDQYLYSLKFLDEDYYLVDEPYWGIIVEINYVKSSEAFLDVNLRVFGYESKSKICN